MSPNHILFNAFKAFWIYLLLNKADYLMWFITLAIHQGSSP